MDQVSFSTQLNSGLNRRQYSAPENTTTIVVHEVTGHTTCLVSFVGEPNQVLSYVLRDCTSEGDVGFQIAAESLTLSASPDDAAVGIAHIQVPAWEGSHLRLDVENTTADTATLEIVSH